MLQWVGVANIFGSGRSSLLAAAAAQTFQGTGLPSITDTQMTPREPTETGRCLPSDLSDWRKMTLVYYPFKVSVHIEQTAVFFPLKKAFYQFQLWVSQARLQQCCGPILSSQKLCPTFHWEGRNDQTEGLQIKLKCLQRTLTLRLLWLQQRHQRRSDFHRTALAQ